MPPGASDEIPALQYRRLHPSSFPKEHVFSRVLVALLAYIFFPICFSRIFNQLELYFLQTFTMDEDFLRSWLNANENNVLIMNRILNESQQG